MVSLLFNRQVTLVKLACLGATFLECQKRVVLHRVLGRGEEFSHTFRILFRDIQEVPWKPPPSLAQFLSSCSE